MPYIIETLNLTKRFPQTKSYLELFMHPFRRKEITALENVTIQVKKGEIFGLLGTNGAGKTTLIKILCTLILPNEGKAFVNGQNVTRNEKEIKQITGYVVSEERSFYWRLTGRQNLAFFATLNNLNGWQAKKRIKEVIELVGLENDIDKIFQTYSSGMKQKLAFARGMLTNPPILFLDEPTRNIDPMAAQNLRRFIKDVIVTEQRKTVIIATNNLNEAEELCDRIAIINRGRLRICESTKLIKRILNQKNIYHIRLRGSFEYLNRKLPSSILNGKIVTLSPDSSSNTAALLTLEIDREKDNISEIIDGIIMSGIDIEAFYPKNFSLDEIFSKIIQRDTDDGS